MKNDSATVEPLSQIAKALSGQEVTDGLVEDCQIDLEGLFGPVLKVTVLYKVDAHLYPKDYFISSRDDGHFEVQVRHNTHRLGEDAASVAKAFLALVRNPIEVRRKLDPYKGWDIYLTTNDGGYGAKAVSGKMWLGTDVSYVRTKDENDERQIHLMIEHALA